MSDVVIVLAKAPEKGKVKTRLASSIGPEKALLVYKELLKRTSNTLQSGTFEVHLHLDNPQSSSLNFPSAKRFQQSGADIGERMLQAFVLSEKAGAGKMLLVGTDIPELRVSILEEALRLLDNYDVVFGPSVDGGYYLIGMKNPKAELFSHIEWSTPAVLDSSLRICDDLSLTYALVDVLNDVDTYEDLRNSSLNTWFTLNFGA